MTEPSFNWNAYRAAGGYKEEDDFFELTSKTPLPEKKWWFEKTFDRVEEFRNQHSEFFSTLDIVVFWMVILSFIPSAGKLMKYVIYQITFTIAKAIKDASIR